MSFVPFQGTVLERTIKSFRKFCSPQVSKRGSQTPRSLDGEALHVYKWVNRMGLAHTRMHASKAVERMPRPCSICNCLNEDAANFCARCGSSLTRIIVKPADATAPPMVWRPTLPATACAYHSSIPFQFTCGRCGKPICSSCARIFLGIVLCVECLRGTPTLPATLAFLPMTYALAPAYRVR